MAERTMKEQRDEIALRIYIELLVHHIAAGRAGVVDVKRSAEESFKCAETWLAAKYDHEKNGSRAT